MVLNPDFIRQLAAFQMLRDHFKLPLVDHGDASASATGSGSHSSSGTLGWQRREEVESGQSISSSKELRSTPEQSLAASGEATNARNTWPTTSTRCHGLPASIRQTPTNPSTDTWNSTPSCTLRFAEVLAKMCASKFRIGELLYLFNAVPTHEHENPFEQDAEDALNYPLNLPEEGHEHSLWKLREALLTVEVNEEEVCHWTWPRIVATFPGEVWLRAYERSRRAAVHWASIFFPDVLEDAGYSVGDQQRQYRISLASTAPWNTPAAGLSNTIRVRVSCGPGWHCANEAVWPLNLDNCPHSTAQNKLPYRIYISRRGSI